MAQKQYIEPAEIVNNPDEEMFHESMLESETSLVGYVTDKTDEWGDFIEANFFSQWDEYYRLWRGLWAEQDSTRSTERSRIVGPALQQAVESSVSEVEEATFGHGQEFSIKDDAVDEEGGDVEFMQKKMREDFRKQRIRQACSQVLINAAVTGTGIAEVVLEEIKEMVPATEPAMEGQVEMVGVNITDRTVVKMRPIMTKNFLIDPVATSIETAHGCASKEFVSAHQVKALQESGVYLEADLGQAATDQDIEPNPELDVVCYEDKVELLKYWGLVPRHLLEKAQGIGEEDENGDISTVVDLTTGEPVKPAGDGSDSYLVEAIVVIANNGVLLKAEENPYMMQDRPVVAFQWDVIPGLFWGRGICEKGYNSQKALDAELRARIDALALTIHPMLAMDATRIPRGHTPSIKPGKMLLTNGNPREIISEFNFGNVNQITFAQAEQLQRMVQQSTGAVDGAEFAQGMGSNNKTGAVSMAMGGVIKRQKRTLINFQDGFWLPFVTKAAHRYMQFDPENYPVKDYNFVAESTLGIMGREYQVSQLVQLLNTTSDKSPMYGPIVESVVNNMNLDNSEELKAVLKKASEPNPEEQAMKKEMHEMEMELQRQQIAAVKAQAAESNARANKYAVEAELEPRKVENDRIDAVADVRDGVTEKEFSRRLKIAETKLKERDLNIKEKSIDLQHKQAMQEKEDDAALEKALSGS
jgi:hypothetical protein